MKAFTIGGTGLEALTNLAAAQGDAGHALAGLAVVLGGAGIL